jgi:hypothetical protein
MDETAGGQPVMTLQCIDVAQAAVLLGGKRSGRELLFQCPCHDDQHPSLSINPEKNCWLCGPCGKSGNAWELAAFISGNDPDNRKAVSTWLRDRKLLNGKNSWEFICDYLYRSANGDPLFRVKRYKTQTGKTFIQERFDSGRWIGGEACMQGVKLIPYKLPEWKDSKMVCIVEGEKDADNLWSLGIPATCNPGGAGKWRPEFNALLAGKDVVIFPDNDEPGERHARDVARNLLSIANRIKIVILPGLPEKGDVSNWIQAGGTYDELIQLIQKESPYKEAPVISMIGKNEPAASLWPDLAAEALYGLPGNIVRSIDPFTEADPASVLVHVLAAFGNIIGSRAHAAVQSDLHPARIFAVVIGESSKGRKGTSWSTPKEIFSRVDSKWSDGRVRCGLSSGEGLIFHVRDELRKTVPVKKGGRIIDYEEEIVDSGESDKRLFCIESEFSSMLKIMGREGNSLSGVVRQAWDTGSLSTLTRNNPLRATGAHVSIIGHTTKDELIRSLSATEQCNGFGNRFLWFLAKRSKALPHGAALPPEILNGLAEQMEQAVSFARNAGMIVRDTPANEMWETIYYLLSEGRPGLAGGLLNRAEAQVLRLSLIYALMDCSSVIRVEHLQAATALWDYCEASVRYIFGTKTGNQYADRITEALLESEDGSLTDDDIGRLFGGHRTREKDLALDLLLRLGKVTKESRQTKGRPVTIWKAA